MRSLDLYSEKQTRDGSPDKIAASTAFVHEANSLSLASLTKDSPTALSTQAHVHDKNDKYDRTDKNENNEKKGLLSLFSSSNFDDSFTSDRSKSRDKVLLAAAARRNPLMALGIGGTFAITEDMKRQEEQAIYDQSVFAERMQRVIARQAFLLKERKEKDEKGDKGNNEDSAELNDTTTMSALAVTEKFKLSFVKEKISIASGTTQPERNLQSKQPRDYIKQNKLLKKKQMLVDYLEKFRGKLSLQEVSEVIGQMEKLDKALSLMDSAAAASV